MSRPGIIGTVNEQHGLTALQAPPSGYISSIVFSRLLKMKKKCEYKINATTHKLLKPPQHSNVAFFV